MNESLLMLDTIWIKFSRLFNDALFTPVGVRTGPFFEKKTLIENVEELSLMRFYRNVLVRFRFYRTLKARSCFSNRLILFQRNGLIYIFYFIDNLELRQYKNDSIQSIKNPVLKLPHFFLHRLGDEKARQFQNWISFRLN